MTEPKRVVVLPTKDGTPGPLGGPFTLVIESDDPSHSQNKHEIQSEILSTIVAFVRHVACGVSCYNNKEFEHSSNLKSYAVECMSDMQSESPESAAQIDALIIDYSRLPASTKAHPIWKLDRAILGVLPGVTFIE